MARTFLPSWLTKLVGKNDTRQPRATTSPLFDTISKFSPDALAQKPVDLFRPVNVPDLGLRDYQMDSSGLSPNQQDIPAPPKSPLIPTTVSADTVAQDSGKKEKLLPKVLKALAITAGLGALGPGAVQMGGGLASSIQNFRERRAKAQAEQAKAIAAQQEKQAKIETEKERVKAFKERTTTMKASNDQASADRKLKLIADKAQAFVSGTMDRVFGKPSVPKTPEEMKILANRAALSEKNLTKADLDIAAKQKRIPLIGQSKGGGGKPGKPGKDNPNVAILEDGSTISYQQVRRIKDPIKRKNVLEMIKDSGKAMNWDLSLADDAAAPKDPKQAGSKPTKLDNRIDSEVAKLEIEKVKEQSKVAAGFDPGGLSTQKIKNIETEQQALLAKKTGGAPTMPGMKKPKSQGYNDFMSLMAEIKEGLK